MIIRNAVTAVLTSCALLAGPNVLAQQPPKDGHEDHHQQGQNKPGEASPAPSKPDANPIEGRGAVPPAPSSAAKPAAGMGMMDQHMKVMREQMGRIDASRDPKERERLLGEHMKSMEQGMAMMQRMKRSSDGAPPNSPDAPSARIDKLEQRMNAMQMMMDQMTRHQRALEGAPK